MVHKLVNIEPTNYYTGHIFILLFFLEFFFFFFGATLYSVFWKSPGDSYFSFSYLRIYIVKIPWNRYWQCSQTGLWIQSKAVDLAELVKADHYYILNICQK